MGTAPIDLLPAPGDRLSDSPTLMLELDEYEALVRRLNRIEGQIRGIRKMMEEPRPCIEVLQQLAAAEAALNRVSLAMFKHHIDHCVRDGLAKGEDEGRRQLNELVDIFDRFGK
jgi:DNA-binding FrmR family transcriptional regulator